MSPETGLSDDTSRCRGERCGGGAAARRHPPPPAHADAVELALDELVDGVAVDADALFDAAVIGG